MWTGPKIIVDCKFQPRSRLRAGRPAGRGGGWQAGELAGEVAPNFNYKERNTPASCAWAGGTFFRCLRKVSPAHQRSAGLWYLVQEFGW